jgi:WG containing repeat
MEMGYDPALDILSDKPIRLDLPMNLKQLKQVGQGMTMRKMCVCRSFLFLIFLTAFAPTAYAQTGDQQLRRRPDYLYQVSTRDKGGMRIGFIDRTGKLVIGFDRLPETTIAVGEFYEGRAVIHVKKDKNDESKGLANRIAGYIDETGAVIIAPRFESARDFSEGLAYVEAEGFRGFIDRAGKPVLKIDDNLTANDFHEGLAAVGTRERWNQPSWGYIDRTGKLVIELKYQFADDFSEGMAGVAVERKYGFINRAGEMVIAPRFRVREGPRHPNLIISAGRFSEGLACVNVYETGMYGYINKKGEFVIPAKYTRAQEFSEGLAWVVEGGRSGVKPKVGWIDQSGRWAVTKVNGREFSTHPDSFYYTIAALDWRYSEGLVPFVVPVGQTDALWGYMDKRGEVVVKPEKFNRLGPFIGGVAWVDLYWIANEDYGYIDKKGRFIWRSK